MTSLTHNERLLLQDVFSEISGAKPPKAKQLKKLLLFMQLNLISRFYKRRKNSLNVR